MWTELFRHASLAWRIPSYRWAFVVALASDALSFGFSLFPLMQWMIDVVTALALWALLGFKWPLLPALAIEVVPALELFPAWTLAVAVYAQSGLPEEKTQA